MSKVKRTAKVLLIGLTVMLFYSSFTGVNIADRLIVLGVGIDYDDGYVVTCEVLETKDGEGATGPSGKSVTARGETVGEAMKNVFRTTGKEVSLGQCTAVILGESMFDVNVIDAVSYFGYSDNFKENSVICFSENAKEFFDRENEESIAVSVSSSYRSATSKAGLPSTNLLTFLRSQTELSGFGFCNVVSAGGDNYSFERLAVFHQGEYVTTLGTPLSQAVAYLLPKTQGYCISVANETPTKEVPALVALSAKQKSLSVSVDEEYRVHFDVIYSVRQLRTDTESVISKLNARVSSELPSSVLANAKQEIENAVNSLFEVQQEQNFDVVGSYKAFHKKYGLEWREKAKVVLPESLQYVVTVKVVEE